MFNCLAVLCGVILSSITSDKRIQSYLARVYSGQIRNNFPNTSIQMMPGRLLRNEVPLWNKSPAPLSSRPKSTWKNSEFATAKSSQKPARSAKAAITVTQTPLPSVSTTEPTPACAAGATSKAASASSVSSSAKGTKAQSASPSLLQLQKRFMTSPILIC